MLVFILSFMMMTKMELVAEDTIQICPYNAAEASQSEETSEAEEITAETVNVSYWGKCRITFYCPCSQCCGSWGNATASGVMPTPGRTVANGSLPFGTVVVIDGAEYVVEDRGVGSDQFDIFVTDHQEALSRGLYYTDVYVKGEWR